jgi:hypothetical protein
LDALTKRGHHLVAMQFPLSTVQGILNRGIEKKKNKSEQRSNKNLINNIRVNNININSFQTFYKI